MEEESGLWKRAREGDADAFARLFDRHRDRVYLHALRLLGDVHDAEDVTAVAFHHLWRKRGDVRLVGNSVVPWLLVTATNTSYNVQRSVRRHRKLLEALPRSSSAPSAEEQSIAASGFSPELATALGGLSSVDRRLVALVMLERLPLKDAAEVLGIGTSATKTRLYRVRKRLREDLAGTLFAQNLAVVGELT